MGLGRWSIPSLPCFNLQPNLYSPSLRLLRVTFNPLPLFCVTLTCSHNLNFSFHVRLYDFFPKLFPPSGGCQIWYFPPLPYKIIFVHPRANRWPKLSTHVCRLNLGFAILCEGIFINWEFYMGNHWRSAFSRRRYLNWWEFSCGYIMWSGKQGMEMVINTAQHNLNDGRQMTKPKNGSSRVLTHYIEGFIIQESNFPFTVTR